MSSTAGSMISYFGAASAVVNPALIYAPVLVGGTVSTLGFTTAAAVGVISAELLSTALASIPALWWVTRISWRKVAVIATLAVVLGNFASVLCDSVETLLLVRTITGLFEGTLLALYLAVIAKTPQPERIFSGKLALQMFIGAVGLAFFPVLIGKLGVQLVYCALGIAAAALLPGIRQFPAGDDERFVEQASRLLHRTPGEPSERWAYSVLVLLFVFDFVSRKKPRSPVIHTIHTGGGLRLQFVVTAYSR